MNRDDVIRMAREAGVLSGYESDLFVRFAELVQAYEREMCASLVEEMVKHDDGLDDFANSVRKGGRRLCSDGRPKWLKISMEVAAEREACALVVENCCSYCAERIRERDGKPRKPMQHAVSVDDITKAALKILDAELTKQRLKP
jgi:hypothetical protein